MWAVGQDVVTDDEVPYYNVEAHQDYMYDPVPAPESAKRVKQLGGQQSVVDVLQEDAPMDLKDPSNVETKIEYDPETVIQREIYLDGKNVCRVNGSLVSVGILRKLGIQLINIHGQHDSASLLDEANHLGFLDAFAGNDDLLTAYTDKYETVSTLRRQIDRMTMDEDEKARRMDTLRYQIAEIEKAELEAGELHQLKRLANNDFAVDSRMMLDVTVARDRDIIFHDICLNDVVITKNSVARIVNLNVSCDGIQAMDMAGDGVIVATPTGSTAYSLSAGGPIMEPETRSVLVTPICAHDMASRSMVVSDKRTVQITLTKNARRNAFLSVDGGRSIKLNMGDVATVKRSSMETKLIRLKDRSFYEIVNQKFRSY